MGKSLENRDEIDVPPPTGLDVFTDHQDYVLTAARKESKTSEQENDE